MEKQKQGAVKESLRVDLINIIVYAILFLGYALTFLVPKFYGATDKYVGLFVFGACVILFFNNVDFMTLIKNKDRELILLLVLLLLTGVNLLIVHSGLGAFFVAADFIMIFYLSKYIRMKKKYIWILSGMYMGLLLYWFIFAYNRLFADFAYYGYNTNTGATFTIYTLLCAFIFAELLYEKYSIAGLLMTMLILKGFQLALWHRARGAFIMLVVFTVFWFIIPKKCWQNKIFYRLVWILATLGSLAFVAFYIALGKTGVNFNLPFFYKSVFSGRELIWQEFFDLFMKSPLTGIGTNVEIESFFEFNVHNAMYNFLVIDGVLVFAGILAFIYIRAREFKERVKNKRVALCGLIILLAVFFESFFDVDLIWADYAYNLLFLVTVINFGREED